MKDIYEMFNDIEIDENEFVEMEIDEVEKMKLKKRLKKSIRKNYNKKGKYVAVASIAFAMVITLGMSFPTYAKQIPIIGDVFSALENSIYKNYKESSNELNITKESNGINITVNDAVFDGTNITLTYTIESEKDLGESITLWNWVKMKGLEDSGSTTSHDFVKVDENTYIGQDNIHLFDLLKNPEKAIDFTLDIRGIINNDDMSEIKGKWKFDISLEATEGQTIVVNESVENEGITATINRLTINPMSTFIAYSQSVAKYVSDKYDSAIMELEVKDDLGNIYQVEGHGGTGDTELNFASSITIEKIKDGANKLIITPKVILKDLGEVKYTEQETKNGFTGESSVGLAETYDFVKIKELILDEIVIELN